MRPRHDSRSEFEWQWQRRQSSGRSKKPTACLDDGNKYEVVRGELFVTPPPSDDHETITARLTRILDPFVAGNSLGMVYHARAVMRFGDSEVEPDLMVRQPHPRGRRGSWDDAPTPVLVVEVISPSTRRRDHEQKRELYLDAGIPEYGSSIPMPSMFAS